MAGFAVDEGHAFFGHVARGDEQRLVMALLGICGEEIENVLDGGRNIVVGGEQAEVGVKAGGGRIVIPGSEMNVAANLTVGIIADDEQELGVRFEVHKAVGNLYAGVFKTARPADVGGFVEAGF